MKKIILLIVILFIVGIWFMRPQIISMYLSRKLQLPVSVEKVHVSKSNLKLINFRIKNPRKYKTKYAFVSKEIDVKYSWDNLKKSPTVIDSIDMQNNFLNIECNNPVCSSNNWTLLMKNIKKNNDKEVIVKKVNLRNFSIEIYGMGLIPGARKKVNIEYISYDNISSKEGFPIEELIVSVFKRSNLLDFIKEILIKNNVFEKLFGEASQEE